MKKAPRQRSLHDLVDRSNAYMHFRYEASMRLYRNLYSLFGSYELLKLKWQLDFPSYYHIWLSEFMQDLHLNEEFLAEKVQEQQPLCSMPSRISLNSSKRLNDIFMTPRPFIEGTLDNSPTPWKASNGWKKWGNLKRLANSLPDFMRFSIAAKNKPINSLVSIKWTDHFLSHIF